MSTGPPPRFRPPAFPPAVKVFGSLLSPLCCSFPGVFCVCGLCGLCDLRNFRLHLAFNACKEILILWPTAKGAQKSGRKQAER